MHMYLSTTTTSYVGLPMVSDMPIEHYLYWLLIFFLDGAGFTILLP